MMIPPRAAAQSGRAHAGGPVTPVDDPRYRAVSAVLEAFMTGDCDAVLALCADGVGFEFPMISDVRLDAATFRRKIGRSLAQMGNLRFFDLEVLPLADGSSCVARYRGTARIDITGRDYRQRYISVLKFAGDELVYFEEYFDTAAFTSAFGLDPGWRMR